MQILYKVVANRPTFMQNLDRWSTYAGGQNRTTLAILHWSAQACYSKRWSNFCGNVHPQVRNFFWVIKKKPGKRKEWLLQLYLWEKKHLPICSKWKFALKYTKNVCFSFRSAKTTFVCFGYAMHRKELIPKTIGNRKRDCARGCARRINTTSENLQIEKHKSGGRSFRSPDWFVLFDLQIFWGGVYPPSATSRTISFSISNSFWYSFDSFFRWEEGRCSRKFDRLFRCFDPLSHHLTEAKRRTRTVSKSAMFLATESVNSAPFKRGETKVQILARKSAKLFANTKVQIFGKERCKIHRQFQRFGNKRCKIHRQFQRY